MARRMNWDKAKQQKAKPRRGRSETIKVHRNSTAATKWGRSTWRR